MARVLISTIFQATSVALSIKKFDIDVVYLLIDKPPKAEQKQAIEDVRKLQAIYKKSFEIKDQTIELYDAVKVAEDVVKIIDSLPASDEIYVDVTHGRRTQAVGVIFATYRRAERIKQLVYWTEEEKKMIALPILPLKIKGKRELILKKIDRCKNTFELIEKTRLNPVTVYRYTDDLRKRGFIEKTDGYFRTTDAGKIAVL
ncbi:MAG: DUF6293 family protein [Candidatus Aenigmatarchaeota archaeon]